MGKVYKRIEQKNDSSMDWGSEEKMMIKKWYDDVSEPCVVVAQSRFEEQPRAVLFESECDPHVVRAVLCVGRIGAVRHITAKPFVGFRRRKAYNAMSHPL